MELDRLARETRSVRRFVEDRRVDAEELRAVLEAARLAPCAANLQRLRFAPVRDRERCSRMFPHLRWAGYLEDWPGPGPGERPAAYVTLMVPTVGKRYTPVDAGIAAGYMVLAARELGLGACMIMSFDRAGVTDLLEPQEGLEPILVVALGEPAERVVLERATGGIEYWRDRQGVHHVPKLSLSELVTGPEGLED